tara:strand:+ start:104 stop:331 length:228 start_codon:yes stop_codon:yes gene_type:complete
MSQPPIQFEWGHRPPFARHPSPKVLSAFFSWLKEQGVVKRSIPMPDIETGEWILFIYQPVDKEAIETFIFSEEEE